MKGFYIIIGYLIIALIVYLIGYAYICWRYKKLNPIVYFRYYMEDEKETMVVFSILWIVSVPCVFLINSIRYILKLIRKCFKIED